MAGGDKCVKNKMKLASNCFNVECLGWMDEEEVGEEEEEEEAKKLITHDFHVRQVEARKVQLEKETVNESAAFSGKTVKVLKDRMEETKLFFFFCQHFGVELI